MSSAVRTPGPPNQRIALHILYPFHRPILEAVHRHLSSRFDCLLTTDRRAVVRFDPAVLIVADKPDKRIAHRLPRTLVVLTRHGAGGKNYPAIEFPQADFVCMSSEWMRDDCLARGWRPRQGYWVTGFAGADPLFSADPVPPGVPASAPRPAGPVLLFAPTYNANLSAINALGPDWPAQLHAQQPGLHIIVKPHPHTADRNPAGWAIVQRLAAASNVSLITDPHADVYRLLRLADVLLTDISSVMFFYLAMDRPMILVDSPLRARETRYYQPDAIEWTWRDAGLRIASADQLPVAVGRCLRDPGEHAPQRREYRRRVFGDRLDGRAAERIAQHVTRLLVPQPADRPWVSPAWASVADRSTLPRHIPYWMMSLARRVGRMRAASASARGPAAEGGVESTDDRGHC